jgi:hypothetical protein
VEADKGISPHKLQHGPVLRCGERYHGGEADDCDKPVASMRIWASRAAGRADMGGKGGRTCSVAGDSSKGGQTCSAMACIASVLCP